MYDSGMSVSVALTKSPNDVASMAAQFKALGDPTRLELMITVAASSSAEACVCDLTPDTGLTQGTVSHHLKILVEAGLLERTQRGKWAYFSLTGAASEILQSLNVAIPTRKDSSPNC
jgi:ArsR family transcriptional regulator